MLGLGRCRQDELFGVFKNRYNLNRDTKDRMHKRGIIIRVVILKEILNSLGKVTSPYHFKTEYIFNLKSFGSILVFLPGIPILIGWVMI